VLSILFAAHPELLGPVLQVIYQAIASFVIKQAGLKRNVRRHPYPEISFAIKIPYLIMLRAHKVADIRERACQSDSRRGLSPLGSVHDTGARWLRG